jgi:Zinc finger, C3HC4 type (RING finger)
MLSSLYPRINQSMYACTFCASPNHVLRECNDRRLDRFEVLCRAKKHDYLDNNYHRNHGIEESISMLRSQQMFTSWLRDYYNTVTEETRRVVRSFAQKKSLASTFIYGRYVDIMIYHIMMYFFELPLPNRRRREVEEVEETEDFVSFSTIPKPWLVVVEEQQEQEQEQAEEEEDCAVCLIVPKDTQFGCQHAFCQTCVGNLLDCAHRERKEAHCPLCRETVTSVTTGNARNIASWSHLCKLTHALPK